MTSGSRTKANRSHRIVTVPTKAKRKRRRGLSVQPRMFSRRPRGVKMFTDPTPLETRHPLDQKDGFVRCAHCRESYRVEARFDHKCRKPWRRPKRDDGSRISSKRIRRMMLNSHNHIVWLEPKP